MQKGKIGQEKNKMKMKMNGFTSARRLSNTVLAGL